MWGLRQWCPACLAVVALLELMVETERLEFPHYCSFSFSVLILWSAVGLSCRHHINYLWTYVCMSICSTKFKLTRPLSSFFRELSSDLRLKDSLGDLIYMLLFQCLCTVREKRKLSQEWEVLSLLEDWGWEWLKQCHIQAAVPFSEPAHVSCFWNRCAGFQNKEAWEGWTLWYWCSSNCVFRLSATWF